MLSETDEYDYPLPRELIAQQPLKHRADARLLVVDRRRGSLEHSHVRDLGQWLASGDQLVLNDTRVLPARLVGRRQATGGRWEGLFLSSDERGFWQILCRTRGTMSVGDIVTLLDHTARDDTALCLVAQQPHGIWIARPEPWEDAHQVLDRIGRIPLPHYIRGGRMVASDRDNYQTVYARRPGSAAAPTAGLHFTPELLADLQQKGVDVRWVTLHIGVDTFRPITARSLSQHTMHTEWAELPHETAAALRAARSARHRVAAVGTSTLRVLETVASRGALEAWKGTTDLFIRPPFEFRAVDALMTNFHLPRSTLLVLVRTFGGDRLIRQAYETAIREQYRFYSYGDAMLIL